MTIIDMRVEPLIRETFAGVIAEDQERLDRAYGELTKLPEEDLIHALRVTTGILYVVLYRMEKRKPTSAEIEQAATELVEAESWVPLRREDVVEILDASANLKDLSLLQPAEKVASLLFLVTGAMIAGCAPAENSWTDYLDDCENMLDSMYGQGPLAQN